MNANQLVWLGLVVIFAGFLLVVMGAFLGSGGPASTGGFILIGPIPIVFGSGQNSGMLASLALAISAVVIGTYVVSFLLWGLGRRREAKVEG